MSPKRISRLAAMAFLIFAMPQAMAAPKNTAVVGRLCTEEWLGPELQKIETRLEALEENQKRILEGQEALSKEHKQLRYWIHKR